MEWSVGPFLLDLLRDVASLWRVAPLGTAVGTVAVGMTAVGMAAVGMTAIVDAAIAATGEIGGNPKIPRVS